MNKQEIFNRVATHLLTQKRRAYDEKYAVCRYRIGDLRCAVGCLIDDANYDSLTLEGLAAEDPPVVGAVRKSVGFVSKSSVAMLQELQGIHDHIPPHEWRSSLSYLAKQFNVKMPS